jgi:hypothetical protein
MKTLSWVFLSLFRKEEVATLVKVATYVDRTYVDRETSYESDEVPEWLTDIPEGMSVKMYNAYLILREFFPKKPCPSWYTAFEKPYRKNRVAWLRRSHAFSSWVEGLPEKNKKKAITLLDNFLKNN